MNFKVSFLLAFLCSFFFSFVQAQDSPKEIQADADLYFKNKRYEEAFELYTQLQKLKSNHGRFHLELGRCNFHLNHLSKAKKHYNYILENKKNPEPLTYYYLAQSYHAGFEFKEAIDQYKNYLRLTKPNDELRKSIKDEIRRCAVGIRLQPLDELAIVENLGENINGEFDDFGPVLSPNYGDKFYFSSARSGRRVNEFGRMDVKFGHYNSDIFGTALDNGEWQEAYPLSPLNSRNNDVIYSFNEDGKVLYYFSGPSLYGGDILIDTFRSKDQIIREIPLFQGPTNPSEGDGDLCFFNDTILLFSSQRDGGYGGKDLYISTFTNGKWQEAENLGPSINTPYDETSPFLAYNGRTLYFSSNNQNSMGGMDIFRAYFDDRLREWTTAINLGFPINSAGDESNFTLSKDGVKAYFDSSRKEGFGQRDIYVAYFKTKQTEQLKRSSPIAFNQMGINMDRKTTHSLVADIDPFGGTENTINDKTDIYQDENVEYKLAPLFYESDDQVVTPPNRKKLDALARLLISYPQLVVELTSHSDGNELEKFDLYFSSKRVEKASDYLVENGVEPSNIILKGCGSNYPIAKNILKGKENPAGKSLNRRIDIAIHNTARLPIKIIIEDPKVSSFMAVKDGIYYKKAIQNLSYKIEVAALKQMYNSDIITEYPYAMIESNSADNIYQYTVGLYQNFSEADYLKKDLQENGIDNPKVVPYINGVRISKEDAKIYATKFPDLLNYIASVSEEE